MPLEEVGKRDGTSHGEIEKIDDSVDRLRSEPSRWYSEAGSFSSNAEVKRDGDGAGGREDDLGDAGRKNGEREEIGREKEMAGARLLSAV